MDSPEAGKALVAHVLKYCDDAVSRLVRPLHCGWLYKQGKNRSKSQTPSLVRINNAPIRRRFRLKRLRITRLTSPVLPRSGHDVSLKPMWPRFVHSIMHSAAGQTRGYGTLWIYLSELPKDSEPAVSVFQHEGWAVSTTCQWTDAAEMMPNRSSSHSQSGSRQRTSEIVRSDFGKKRPVATVALVSLR